jgi:predicted transcriptional regulator
MKTVTLDVRKPADSMADFTKAWETGKAQESARISFATPELLWKVLTAKRWELLKVLCGAGPVSIREAARRVGRDVKAVHGDVTVLLTLGYSFAPTTSVLSFHSKLLRSNFCCMRHSRTQQNESLSSAHPEMANSPDIGVARKI